MATRTESSTRSALDITRPETPGPSLGTHLPASYVRDLGRLMYFWGWPLVNMRNKAKNWLPAPKEDFEVFVRAYWADTAILENKWSPPPVVRAR